MAKFYGNIFSLSKNIAKSFRVPGLHFWLIFYVALWVSNATVSMRWNVADTERSRTWLMRRCSLIILDMRSGFIAPITWSAVRNTTTASLTALWSQWYYRLCVQGGPELIEQSLTSHQKHYRSYRGRFLQLIWPNQQCQSTEGNQLVWQMNLESHQDHSTMLQ